MVASYPGPFLRGGGKKASGYTLRAHAPGHSRGVWESKIVVHLYMRMYLYTCRASRSVAMET